MKKLSILILCLAAFGFSNAQDAEVKEMQSIAERAIKEDTIQGWHLGGAVSLNLAQGGSKNWAAGAEKFSLSVASYATLYANLNRGRWRWNTNLDMGYALVNTTSTGVRKNDDKIDLFSKAGYQIASHWFLSGIVNFRSQFSDGYDYDYLGKGLQRRISDFFAPAYITVAPGFEWKPNAFFSLFMTPISARWIIVTNEPYSYYYPGGVIPGGGQEKPLATRYGVDPVKKVDFQAGAYISANFKKEIMKNVVYKSRLDLYSNYLEPSLPDENGEFKAKPQNVDVYWTNAVVMKVNKWLSVTYNLDLIYDDDVRQFGDDGNSAGLQVRSLLGVGLTTRF